MSPRACSLLHTRDPYGLRDGPARWGPLQQTQGLGGGGGPGRIGRGGPPEVQGPPFLYVQIGGQGSFRTASLPAPGGPNQSALSQSPFLLVSLPSPVGVAFRMAGQRHSAS